MDMKKLEAPKASIVEQIVNRLDDMKRRYNNLFEEKIEDMKRAPTIDAFMRAKRSLLEQLVTNLPLGTGTCYFCIENTRESNLPLDCDNCEYGRKFGECEAPTSTYKRTIDAKTRLMQQLSKYYR